MLKKLKSILIGKPLNSEELHGEKLGILWGLPLLSSDAISSVAYAGQEMLLVLIPAIGLLAFKQMAWLSCAIIVLLFIVMLSYRQTIDSYPNGGGAYVVAKENLGVTAGVTAGAALSAGYILTVAVSVCAGVDTIVTTFPVLKPYDILLCTVLILLLMVGNLRGLKESSVIFGIPTYAFILAVSTMIIYGFIKLATGYTPEVPATISSAPTLSFWAMTALMLQAFSRGCSALTGVEAISNSVPNFKDPSTKYAKKILLLLSIVILFLFGGSAILVNFYQVDVTGEDAALLILMAKPILGNGFMFYFLMITTFIILIIAANTAFVGFPMLISVVSKEGYAPRQLSKRGDRLAYDNGIIILSLIAIALIIIFKANVSSLIGLYAIGVFISFTLSQLGMFVKWIKCKEKNWLFKALINGFGAFITSIAVVVIAITQFSQGAWIVVLLIPILVVAMLKIKKHYDSIRLELKVKEEHFERFNNNPKTYVNHVIVPIASVNQASLRAIKYAYTVANSKITVFTVAIDEESKKKIEEKYKKLDIKTPLTVVYSPYRKIVEPMLEFINSEKFDYQEGDMVTVILPQFNVQKRWSNLLHNHTTFFIEKQLLKHRNIVVSKIPFQLND